MSKIKVMIRNNQKLVKLPVGLRLLVRKCCQAVLVTEKFEHDAEVSVSFVDNKEIRQLNKLYRNKDKSTDVLSFPMVDYEIPGEFDFLEERDDCFNPETGELVLGDIVISKEKVISQAEEYGHSIEREYAFLIAHSMLHLFGYDHMEEDERIVMETKQKEILERLQILR